MGSIDRISYTQQQLTARACKMLASSPANAATLVGQIASQLSSHNILLSGSVSFPVAAVSSNAFTKLPAHSSDACDVALRLAKASSTANGAVPRPISLYASAEPLVLSSIVTSASFKHLLGFPVLLHLSTNGDHANLLNLFKSSGAVIVYSASAEEAQKNTLVAAKIAVNASRLVLHFFEGDSTEGKKVDDLLQSDAFLAYGDKLKGHVNGATNGFTNGTNGANGHSEVNTTTGNQDEDNLPSRHHSLQSAIDEAYQVASENSLGLGPTHYAGPAEPTKFVVALGASVSLSSLASSLDTSDTGVLSISLYRPLTPAALLELIPQSVKSIVVLEQAYTKVTR